MQPAEERMRLDASDPLNRAREGRVLVQRSVRPHVVVIAGIGLQNPAHQAGQDARGRRQGRYSPQWYRARRVRGSGSTLIAAHKIGRRARIAELDPVYVGRIVRRWQAYANDDAMLKATGETFEQVARRRVRATLRKEMAQP
jgi:hypothetical protein